MDPIEAKRRKLEEAARLRRGLGTPAAGIGPAEACSIDKPYTWA